VPSTLSLSKLTLETAALEMRYQRAFSMWDHAGAAAEELRSKWPEIKLHDANPAKLLFSLPETYEMTVELEKAFIVAYHPPSKLDSFCADAKEFFNTVHRHLNVSEYSRVGLRLVYIKDFDALKSATEAALSLGTVKLPEGKFFGQEGTPKSVDLQYRWENKSNGMTVRLRTEGVIFELSPGLALRKEVQPFKREKHRFVYDTDYYTVAAVTPSQLRIPDWVNNALHLIHRDSKLFLGE
jgi:hypothetical protein